MLCGFCPCKWPLILIIWIVAAFFLLKNSPTDPERVSNFAEKIHFIGHRGSPEEEPENTLDSLEYARLHNVNTIECDISLTKDGIPVLFHDPTLDRITNKTGFIRNYNLKLILNTVINVKITPKHPYTMTQFSELNDCNLAAKFRPKKNSSSSHKFASLFTVNEAMRWAKLHKIKLIFDVKVTNDEMRDALIQLFEKNNFYDHAIVSSFNPYFIYTLKQHDSKIMVALSWSSWRHSYHDEERKQPIYSNVIMHIMGIAVDILNVYSSKTWLPSFLGIDFVLPHHYEVSEEYVKSEKAKGRVIFVWTVNAEAEIRWMLEKLNVAVISNNTSFFKTLK